jgi:nucleotide-binding universal stress UspA family protein
MARKLGGSLVLVHALTPRPPSTFTRACGSLSSYRADVQDARHLLRELATLAPEMDPSTELRFGDPAQAICRAAEDRGAELIVVGSRGLGKLHRLLLGSVSRAVVEGAPCSVLVVRHAAAGDELAATSAFDGFGQ